MTTSNQEIQKSNQPRKPSPVFLLLCRDPAEIQLIIIACIKARYRRGSENRSPIIRSWIPWRNEEALVMSWLSRNSLEKSNLIFERFIISQPELHRSLNGQKFMDIHFMLNDFDQTFLALKKISINPPSPNIDWLPVEVKLATYLAWPPRPSSSLQPLSYLDQQEPPTLNHQPQSSSLVESSKFQRKSSIIKLNNYTPIFSNLKGKK